MKSSNVKKILSIVIVSLVLAITALTVILALIPKTLYNPIAKGYSYVYVHQKDDEYNTYLANSESQEQKDVLNKIDALLKESVKDNLLSSIFQGTGSFDTRVVIEKKSSVMSDIAKASGATSLVFGYAEDQEFVFKGKKFKNPQAVDPDKVVTFRKLVMPLTSDQDFQERIVYLVDVDGNCNYQIKFLAHQSDLYNYVESLEWN